MVSLAVRNLRRRSTRTVLTMLGVALAIAAFVALIGLSRAMVHTLKNSFEDRGTHLLVSEAGAMDVLGSSVTEALVQRIARLDGVAAASGELVRFAPSEKNVHLIVAGWTDGGYLWQSLALSAGRLPHRRERRVVVLGERIARALGKQPGDTVEIQFSAFKIVGIIRSTSLFNRSMAIMPLSDLQALIHRQGRVTVIHVKLFKLESRRAIQATRGRIAAIATGYEVDSAERFHENMRVVRVATAIAWAVSIVALIMGVVAVVNTLLIAVAERVGEIAMLSAIGWSRSRILTSILIEGLAISMIGGVAGAVFGIIGTAALAELPQVRGLIDPQVTPGLIVLSISAAVLLGAVGSLLPAWRATRIDPVEGLRRFG